MEGRRHDDGQQRPLLQVLRKAREGAVVAAACEEALVAFMTIIAHGPGFIACGSVDCVQRQRGRRLSRGLGQYVGRPFRELPDDALDAYGRWLVAGPDGWFGHSFECFDIEDELERRRKERADA